MSSVQAPPRISISQPKEADVPPPPAYTASTLSRSRSHSSISSQTSSLPGYDDAPAIAAPALSVEDVDFFPTAAFQIQTQGKGWISHFGPTRPDPIPVYAVDPSVNSDTCSIDMTPKYVSLRASRRSGNCVLIHGADFPDVYSPSSSSSRPNITSSKEPALASTLYRFGCGRAPRVRIYPGEDGPDALTAFENMSAARSSRSSPEKEAWALDSAGAGEAPAYTVEDSEKAPAPADKKPFTAPLNPVSPVSRAIRFATPHGTFQWRYSTRAERKAFGGAHSLLVLEHLVPLPAATDGAPPPKKGEDHVRVPVGYFVRSEATRSPGSGRSTAGNGGRLLLDLRSWDGTDGYSNGVKSNIVDEKRRLAASDAAGADTVERVAIATCLAMLKKEVDRRRMHQAVIFVAAVSGGP